MSMRREMKSGQQDETGLTEAEVAAATDENGSRKMTFAENLVVTIKVLAGFGLLGAALWGLELWTATR